MKILKATKVMLIAVCVMLLVCSAVGFAVYATESEENYAYEIPMVNISHGASSALLFAVDAPIADAEAGNIVVTYTYYVGAEKKSAVAKYSEEITANANIGKPVFYTVGISPKDQAETITVEAHKADAPKDFEPLYYSTSVGKYLYSRLYRDGLIFSENENAKRFIKMYLAQIEYVSTCQDALWNAENEGNERKLLNTYNYVCVTDGVIAASGNAHDLIDGETVTLNYTGSSTTQIGWTVTTYDESGVASTETVIGDTVTLKGNSVISPYFDSDIITFENFALNDTIVNEFYQQNGVDRIYSQSTSYVATVVKGRDGGKGLRPMSYIWLYANNYENQNHNVSLLEMDLDFTTMTDGKNDQLQFKVGTGGTDQFKIEFRYLSSTSQLRFDVKDVIDSTKSVTKNYYNLPEGNEENPKFNLKVEYLWTTGDLKITVDGTVVFDGVISTSETPVFRINYQINAENTVILDNIKQVSIYVDPEEFAK